MPTDFWTTTIAQLGAAGIFADATELISEIIVKHGITGVMLIAFLYGVYLIMTQAVPSLIERLQMQLDKERERSEEIRKDVLGIIKENAASTKDVANAFTQALDRRDLKDREVAQQIVQALDKHEEKEEARNAAQMQVLERACDKLESLLDLMDKCRTCEDFKPQQKKAVR